MSDGGDDRGQRQGAAAEQAALADEAAAVERAASGEGGSAPASAPAKPPGRMQQLVFEYGAIGIITLLTISALTWLGFAAAFMVGFQVEGAGETAGAFAAASAGWLLTKPIRIPLAIVLTPIVAAVWHRIRGKKPGDRKAE